MKLAIPLMLAAVAIGGCKDRVIHVEHTPPGEQRAETETGDGPELILRSYEVPSGYGEQIKSMLNGLLYNVKDRIGASARLTPNNELVVIAPAGIHDGIATMIERLGKGGAPEVPPTIEMTYWIVFGEPADQVAVPAQLSEIKGALEAVSAAQGPMKFSQGDRGSVVSQSNEHASSRGRFARFQHRASYSQGALHADLSIEPQLKDNPAKLETRVKIDPGTTLVLGQVGYGESLDGRPERQLFYVVRANVTTDK